MDSSITDSVILATGGQYDGMYMTSHLSQGSSLVDRCRFERSGIFDENAVGQGGDHCITPPGGFVSFRAGTVCSLSAWNSFPIGVRGSIFARA